MQVCGHANTIAWQPGSTSQSAQSAQATKSVLVIGDVSEFDWRDDFLIDQIEPACRCLTPDHKLTVIPFDKQKVAQQLAAGHVAALVVAGVMDYQREDPAGQFLHDAAWLQALQAWVHGGGVLTFVKGAHLRRGCHSLLPSP